ncbi:SGNH/GDSL hydrolase family protein [Xanthomonas sp. LMG 8992]|uniref:SGNH/GDSL hydrolase family protein n=1 Tax=Xanthomonas sp. LMG 8992 TaxID=1591157 RepID=UPI001367D73F|nr:SGNH/GDSL hydrolase family protein [Xanthomonas sp. LMG 8992]MXV11650.1 SGNH/GDSL hydrolase family protein [Xanthomonas sp. LMG 8992]
MQLALSTGLGRGLAPRRPRAWLYGTANNVIHNAKDTQASRTGYCVRWPYIVGSGDVQALRLRHDAWCLPGATSVETLLGNTMPIDAVSVEYNGVVVPARFAGARGIVLADGAYDVLSDIIPASAFGVPVIPRGATLYVKVRITMAAAGQYMPTSARHTSQSGAQVRWFDPAVTTPSDIDAPGAWTFTGTAPASRTGGYSPVVLAQFAGAEPPVRLIVGDSISQGTGDTSGVSRVTGLGYPGILLADLGDGKAHAFCSVAVHGSVSTVMAQTPRYASYARYANRAIVMYGTNDLGTAGNGVTLAALQARILSGIAALKQAPGSRIRKVIAGHLAPRTTSTDNWATAANQAYSAASWGTGGTAAQYNAWLTSSVGTQFDGAISWPSIRDASDPLRWLTNGTASYPTVDGTHPTSALYARMAADAVATVNAVA